MTTTRPAYWAPTDLDDLPPACWECRDAGDPWEHDCDQCNPDGMYDRHGRERHA